METVQSTIDEINDGIYRISTWVPEVSPDGFTFNQFLVLGEEPLLFHTGPRGMFPLVAEAVARIVLTPPHVLIHRLEVRTLTVPVKKPGR